VEIALSMLVHFAAAKRTVARRLSKVPLRTGTGRSKIRVNPTYVWTGRGPYIQLRYTADPGKSPVGNLALKGPGAFLRLWSTGMAETTIGKTSRGAPQRSRRPRDGSRRHKVEFRLNDEELELLEEAASRSGRARGAHAAEITMAALRGGPAAENAALREMLRELYRAAGLVRRIGVNLNQAVAKLNATGQRSGDLLPYAAESIRRAERLDTVAEEIRKALR